MIDSIISSAYAIIKYQIPIVIFIILYCISLIVQHKSRKALSTKEISSWGGYNMLYISIITTSIIAGLINSPVTCLERPSFIAQVMASVGFVSLAAQWLDQKWFERSAKGIALSLTLATVMFIHLGMVITYLIPVRQSYYETLDEIRKNPDGVHFSDNMIIDMPLLGWRKLPYNIWDDWNLSLIEKYLSKDTQKKYYIRVLPLQLRSADSSSCPSYNGNTDIHVKNGILFRKVSDTNCDNITLDYGPFKRNVKIGIKRKYLNKDNELYEWIDLSNPYFPFFLFDIKAIYRND
jgi:hypothetical protein